MKDLIISVVVPVYNADKTIEKCVESIINQTYSYIEIILVNDGSEDKSGEICDRYERENKNVKYIAKSNGGVSSARNIGIDNASGFFVMFVDSDDYIQPDYCENMISAYKKSQADLILCGYSLYANTVLQTNVVATNESVVSKQGFVGEIMDLFELGLMNPPYGKLFKKSLIKNNFIEELSLGEDLLFVLDYLKECQLICIEKNCGYNYVCDNVGSLSNKFRREGDAIAMELYNRALFKCNEIWDASRTIEPVLAEKCYRNLIAHTETIMRHNALKWNEKRALIKHCIDTTDFLRFYHRTDLKSSPKQRRYAFYVSQGLYYIYYIESNFRLVLKQIINKRI